MIRVVLADMLCELGYIVAAEAASIDEALEATRKTDFDLAILDADLEGRSVSPVADALVARDIRFVFITGYGLPAYRERPTLRKPFQIDALKRALQDRAKTELDLIVPQRFFTHQQAKLGDRHVYASRSRFVPDTILGSFDKRNWRDRTDSSIKVARKAGSSVVDVAASLMRMWQ